MNDPEKYTISLDKDVSIFDALNDECSDLRAWAAASLVLAVSDSEEIPPNSHIDQFLYFLLGNQDTMLGKALLSQFRSSDHPWINAYLGEMAGRTSDENASKMTMLLDLFERLHLLDPHQTIPILIELLGEKSDAPRRERILRTIAFLEQPRASKETPSEFLLSSYIWNIRSAELRRKFWMSLMSLTGTLMYGLVVALIASLSLPYPSFRDLLFVGLTNLFVIGITVCSFILCLDRLSKIEKNVEPRFEIGRDFLESRGQLKTRVAKSYVSFMEKKHEKWRNVLSILIRLYVTITVSSVVAAFLGRLPMGTVLYFLITLTVFFLMMSVLTYGKTRSIETELARKQRILRRFYAQ